MSESVIEIQESQFDQQVLNQSKPIIIDFWAPWCGPCKAMGPVFGELAAEYAAKMVFAKCNVDENQSIAAKYGIKAIPTLMIFQGGQVVNSITGMSSRSALETAINSAIAGEAPKTPFVVQ
ncbi:thioredoxin [Desulfosarcina ovata]|uniref:Thioredoxin n=2 Tax=Desulfosarcina ovata TaxID=83564 RepID=A0A5K8ACU1_9BACT|nr:thioredoxin [Desulfosarcina ovata]BBO83412.1 thioredoxin [Desulfosarcina ovata subsp. sediminis]BBO89760.1 thioredoxin [Desulfosarcina ovata subsp. ovata]